jgi:hypothetical protein
MISSLLALLVCVWCLCVGVDVDVGVGVSDCVLDTPLPLVAVLFQQPGNYLNG